MVKIGYFNRHYLFDMTLDVIWQDLHDNGFHNTGGLMTTMTGDGLLTNRTTQLGQEFLKFITSPKE